MGLGTKTVISFLVVILCLSMLLPLGQVLATGDITISISTSGTIKKTHENTGSLKIRIYESSWNFNEYNETTLSNTFGMSQSWWIDPSSPYNHYDSKMTQVLETNPDFKFLVYRNVMTIYSYWSDEWNYANSQGWLLKDSQGNYVTESSYSDNYMVDITNASYQQWVANRCALWLEQHPQFAGVMADNGLKYSASEWAGAANSTPIDQSTGLPFTTQKILDGCAGTLNAIINALGPDKMVTANGIWTGFCFDLASTEVPMAGQNYRYILSQVPGLKGIMSEGPFYQSYSTHYYSVTEWQQSINMVKWIQDNFLSNPENQFIALVPAAASIIPEGTSKLDLAMFGYCSLLLAAEKSDQNNIGFGGTPSTMSQDTELLSFAQQIRNLDIGLPIGNYYQASGSSLFARTFTGGLVLVNPSDNAVTYPLGHNYYLMDGSATPQSLVINPHQGVILLNQKQP
ncbi:MAG: putative glycoside hydrolase family 15 protein [Candidatus Bathyarchaeota archaeon]|nr:putative glycoside hydrolase family 15 protein [Candidatus Bathyarchaeota archaeon]